MANNNLGKAYVQIVPSAKGLPGSIEKMLKPEAEAAGKSAGASGGGSFLKNFGGAIGGIGKTITAGIGAAAAGVAAAAAGIGKLVSQSIAQYADYEQLTGGIETLFGDSAQAVMNDAREAYRTAGLSMNEYMETSIQSAASLINSLGGDQQEAARLMNVSITDMADNVNKMGTSMEAVQNAYRGFSRGNFTMLDNLALGFAGTKEGMQQLLDQAQQISGIEYDIGSYADIVEAIHVVQTEMGITGTTTKEASETISGSLASMRAMWQNVMTGIADENRNFGADVSALVESVVTVAGNIMPRIQTALAGVGQLVQNLAPLIAQEIPALMEAVLPPLLDAAVGMVDNISRELPGLVESLLPPLMDAFFSIFDTLSGILPTVAPPLIMSLAQGLIQAAPMLTQCALDLMLMLAQGLMSAENVQLLVDAAYQMVTDIVWWIGEYSGELLTAAVDIVIALAEALTSPDNLSNLIDAAIGLILYLADAILDNLDALLDAAMRIVENLMTALIENAPKLLKAAVELISKFVSYILDPENLAKILALGVNLVTEILKGILDTVVKLVDAGKEIIGNIKDGFMQKIEDAKNWGRDLIQNFIGGITEKWNALKESIVGIANTVKSFLGFSEPEEGPLSDFHTYAPDMMELYAQGISNAKGRVIEALRGAANDFETAIQPQVNLQAAPAAAAGGEGVNVHIVVNAAPGMDEEALAQKIARQFRQEMIGRRAVLA